MQINKTMHENTQTRPDAKNPPESSTKSPNESGRLYVHGFLRIFDPKTKQTYVETRG